MNQTIALLIATPIVFGISIFLIKYADFIVTTLIGIRRSFTDLPFEDQARYKAKLDKEGILPKSKPRVWDGLEYWDTFGLDPLIPILIGLVGLFMAAIMLVMLIARLT